MHQGHLPVSKYVLGIYHPFPLLFFLRELTFACPILCGAHQGLGKATWDILIASEATWDRTEETKVGE